MQSSLDNVFLQIWESVKVKLSKQIGHGAYHAYIMLIEPYDVSGDSITFTVPSNYILEIVNKRYKAKIADALKTIANKSYNLSFVILNPNPDAGAAEQKKAKSKVISKPEASSNIDKRTVVSINHNLTFENYVIGDNNRMAQAAAMAVANNPGSTYNPLFVYGGVGLGKTHLLHAIGNKALSINPSLNIIYMTSEEFINLYVQHLTTGKMDALRNKVRKADIFMIDDIQFIENKESYQEEFFHTFNALHSESKQIVLTSDRPPKNIATLTDRLKSRFEWGLTVDIQPPSLETRMAIINLKAEQRGVKFDPDVTLYLASLFQSNIREMEGQLTKLVVYSQVHQEPITQRLAEKLFGNIVRREIDMDRIITVVGSYYNIGIDDILGSKRTANISIARQIAMYLCRSLGNFTTTKIGNFFGGKKHTTVMHSVDKIEKDLKINEELRKDVEEITNKIKRVV